ncbi:MULTISPECIES: hypothetical protein [unclassified Neptuniibacter]|uniref:DUF2515 family protein n=1 Tax=unclassified Neptuniibacter TaxID=2630693 RepID=UPI0025D31C5A|nr:MULTISPECIES: hypothetical protein [unclassified Neptuniibacter]|tara:strand:+ start:3655 stop:4575 length:921 start_codon:yes stop_codon:yes gene_type:complete
MALDEPIRAVNDTPDKVVDIVCDCDFLWSMAHVFCYKRLSEEVNDNEYNFLDLYSARAKRIAATYARFYLETEENGEPAKRGRYYWMALGAFASKTVACLLDDPRVQTSYFVGYVGGEEYLDHEDVANGLTKGNVWLFLDIAASHWFYNTYPDEFRQGMYCETKRNADTLEKPIKEVTNQIPWAQEVLPKINNFQPSAKIMQGFTHIQNIEGLLEGSAKKEKIQSEQWESLLKIAEHEQYAILQKVIYNDPEFSYWAEFERHPLVPSFMSPTYQLVFNHQCTIDDSELKSVAPDDLIVEDYRNRMD